MSDNIDIALQNNKPQFRPRRRGRRRRRRALGKNKVVVRIGRKRRRNRNSNKNSLRNEVKQLTSAIAGMSIAPKPLGFRGFNVDPYKGMNYGVKHGANLYKNYNSRLLEYLAGIVEPEIPLQEGVLIKQPNLISIPSTTTSFMCTHNLCTDANGDFFVNWVPNFLCNTQSLANITYNGNVKCNTYAQLNTYAKYVKVGAGSPTSIVGLSSFRPNIDLSKYRLVSAKISVSYIGKAINTAGVLYGCVSYDPCVVGIGHSDADEAMLTYHQRSGNTTTYTAYEKEFAPLVANFNLKKIQNGLWPREFQFPGSGSGLSVVFIPSDPTDEIFYKLSEFYGDKRAYDFTQSPGDSSLVPLVTERGAHANYYFTGHGMEPESECVKVTCVYNFEVIPTAETATALRINNNDDIRRVVGGNGEKIKTVLFNMANKGDTWDVVEPRVGLAHPDLMKKTIQRVVTGSIFGSIFGFK